MSYEPTNWKTGDVVTSQKLNKLEQGVTNAGGVLTVMVTYNEQDNTFLLDKTFKEIYDAASDGIMVVIHGNFATSLCYGYIIMIICDETDDTYTAVAEICVLTGKKELVFTAQTENDYPIGTEREQ